MFLLVVSVSAMTNSFMGDVNVGGMVTAEELNVTSNDSIYLGWMKMDNQGTHTYMSGDFIIHDESEATTTLGVHAHNDAPATHAEFILEAGTHEDNSVMNIIKNGPNNYWAANSSAIINDGTHGTFVKSGNHITWWDFDSFVKSPDGEIENLTGMNRWMMLNSSSLNLETVGLNVNGPTNLYADLNNQSLRFYENSGEEYINVKMDSDGDLNFYSDSGDTRLEIPDSNEQSSVTYRGIGVNGIYHLYNDDTDTALNFGEDVITFYAGGDNYMQLRNYDAGIGWQNFIAFNYLNNDVDFKIDSDTIDDAFFLEGSSGRVGIGTNSPTQKLDVDGNVNVSGIYYGDGSGLININKSHSSYWTQNESNIYYDTGNVGIGTTDPTSVLDIEKAVGGVLISKLNNTDSDGISQQIVVANGGGQINLIANSGPGSHLSIPIGNAGIAVDQGGVMVLAVGDDGSATKIVKLTSTEMSVSGTTSISGNTDIGNGDFFVNASSGRVGIGTNTPGSLLDVRGRITAENIDTTEIANRAGDLKIQPDVQGDAVFFGDTDVDDADDGKEIRVWRKAEEGNDYIRMYISKTGNALIHSDTNIILQNADNKNIQFNSGKSVFFNLGDSDGSDKIKIRDKSSMEVGVINSNGDAWFMGDLDINGSVNLAELLYVNVTSGYVGVGTTNPTYMFDVHSANDKQAMFMDTRNQDAGVGGGIMFGGKYTDGGLSAMAAEIRASKTNSISGDVGFDLIIETQDSVGSITERAIFTSDGLIGLNVPMQSSPTKPLDVWGDTRIRGDLTVDGSINGGNVAFINQENTFGAFDQIFDSYTFFIDSTNNRIGIGTSDPKEELHINSTHPTITFEESDAGSNEKVWEIGVANEEFIMKTANDLHTGTSVFFRAGNRGGTDIGYIEFPNVDIIIEDLSGSGNDYACLDSTGKLFRSNSAC